jgi:organic radical activating enzyme
MNFLKFIENFKNRCSQHHCFVFYGASKDLAQLIESLDIILEKKLNFDLIIDDDIEGSFDSIYDINSTSYKPDGKILPNNRKLNIKNSKIFFDKDFDKKKHIIITTSDAKKNLYFNFLDKLGLEKHINYFDYKEFVSLMPLILKNKIHIWRADIMLTEKCTLNCTFCNMYMPHFKSPKHRELSKIKLDLDLFFNHIDYVSIFHLVGGEPMMYPELNGVIDYVGENFRDKIGRLLITTNGTLTPKDDTINLFRKYNLLVSISDYTEEVNYGRRLKDTVEKLVKTKVQHFIRKDIAWNDFGHPEIEKFKTEKEVIEHFRKCTAPYKGINNGRYYFCHLNTSANLAGLIREDPNDFYDLNKKNKIDLLKHDLGFLNKGYATFCKNCYGCNTGIDLPVGPGEQGLRLSS